MKNEHIDVLPGISDILSQLSQLLSSAGGGAWTNASYLTIRQWLRI